MMKFLFEKVTNAQKKTVFIWIIALTTLAVVMGFSGYDKAPPARIGYMSMFAIMNQMPETDSAESELRALNQQFATELQSRSAEFQTRQQQFQQSSDTLDSFILDKRRNELQALADGIRQFEQEANEEMNTRRDSLMQPIYLKVADAIDQIASERGFTHVINVDVSSNSGPLLLYGAEEFAINDLIMERLGLAATRPEEAKE